MCEITGGKNMDKIMYYVCDDASGNCSPFYNTVEEAEKDMNEDISYAWGMDAQVVECLVR